jgi:hypothetical protein
MNKKQTANKQKQTATNKKQIKNHKIMFFSSNLTLF